MVTQLSARHTRIVTHLLIACIAILAAAAPIMPAHADPADINAAARGVVRVVIVGDDGDEVYAVSHGSGFAVSPERIITNAHVVQEAVDDPSLSIGIVPADGENAVYGRLISVSPRNDLALIETTSPLNLPPLSIASGNGADSGPVVSVGYPMNVDRAQGLNMEDIFHSTPPVKSTGFLSGRRPSRDFDTLLHTAPIARGNSGGPLLDECGRVIGVNSFGAESGGADAEFFFAVSTRELLPFLRANDVSPKTNGLACRSLADLNQEERQRAQREQMMAQQKANQAEAALAHRRDEIRRTVNYTLISEREDGMAIALLLLIIALGGGGYAVLSHREGKRRAVAIAGGITILSVVGAMISWISRPDFSSAQDRVERVLRAEMEAEEDTGVIPAGDTAQQVTKQCTLDVSRSRITGSANDSLDFKWNDNGCVNERTQYGLSNGEWSRVFVPSSEAAVTISRFDPQSGKYSMDRYLLGRDDLAKAREARGDYQTPECGGLDAAREVGASQDRVISLLPDQPNERLVYSCTDKSE
ncbi:S1 family peptidase [Altericroceibacterium endophyticum]|uniref:Trypsin-like serine protease n=1 Tax=Altericroceibacterium endophyticum TaxID=1808508 RepID=A0A6I4T2A6_9SPHN|nr:serine protease [Altericroceibacterium endophyticum]MXO64259.1 trypsin-like serine protease [Altericroceibacterium endophyticum]